MLNLIEFLKFNVRNSLIKLGTPVHEVEAYYGKPREIVGTEEFGWLYYKDGARLIFFDGVINEVGFDLKKLASNRLSFKHEVINEQNKAIGVITAKTTIREFLTLLTEAGIKYRYLNFEHNSGISIITSGNVVVRLDIDDNRIDLINYMGVLHFDQIPTVNDILQQTI